MDIGGGGGGQGCVLKITMYTAKKFSKYRNIEKRYRQIPSNTATLRCRVDVTFRANGREITIRNLLMEVK